MKITRKETIKPWSGLFFSNVKTKTVLLFIVLVHVFLIQNSYGQCTDPSPESVCTPPNSWNKDVVATGTVTWSSLGIGSADDVQNKIRISGTGTVRVPSGDLLLKSSNAVLFIDGPTLVLENGNLQLTTSGSSYIQHGGALQTYGNFQQTGDTYICIIGTHIEVGEEMAGTDFTDQDYTSANWQNDGGYRYLKNDCINVTQDFQLQSSGSGTGTSGVDVIIESCIEIGDAGANHATPTDFGNSDGDDSGNWQNSNRQYIARTDIIVANGNYQTSDGTMTLCEVDIKVNKSGNFQVNSGTLEGDKVCVATEDIFENSGTWTATNVTWYSDKNNSTNVPNAGSETAKATILADCFDACSCEPQATDNIDLELVKSISDATPNVGSTVTFTISVQNTGTMDATGVSIEDIVPSGYENISNISNNGSETNSTITWSGLTIAASNSLSLTFQATVKANGVYTNTAQVAAVIETTDPDSNPNNDDGDQSEDDEDSVIVTPIPQIDLELTKTINSPVSSEGSIVTFTITITNKGPSDATGVAFQDHIPSGYTNISNISNNGSYSNNSITWAGFTIVANQSTSVTFDAEVLASGNYKNVAEITAHNEADIDSQSDNDDGDQSQDDEDSASTSLSPASPNIVIGAAKMASIPDSLENGIYEVSYRILVINLGDDPIYDLSLLDTLNQEFGTYENSVANVDAAGEYTITNAPSIINSSGGATITTLNNTYNGDSDPALLVPTLGESLPVGASITLQYSIRFYPAQNKSDYVNNAYAGGDTNEDGTADKEVEDIADYGGCFMTSGPSSAYTPAPNADPDCDGNPNETGENDPTIISISLPPTCSISVGVLGY